MINIITIKTIILIKDWKNQLILNLQSTIKIKDESEIVINETEKNCNNQNEIINNKNEIIKENENIKAIEIINREKEIINNENYNRNFSFSLNNDEVKDGPTSSGKFNQK